MTMDIENIYPRVAKIISEVPEVEKKVEEGSLSLTNLVQAQVFFRKEEKLQDKKLSIQEKREVLSQLENKSKHEAQRALLKISPQQVTLKESTRAVTDEHTEAKIVLPNEVIEKLEKLKMLLSHKNPGMNLAGLINELADLGLKKYDPLLKQEKKKVKTLPPPEAEMVQQLPQSKVIGHSRYNKRNTVREVWRRDQGQCSFIDSLTKRRCESKFQLEIHHQIPFAMGGQSTTENLKLFCKGHNKLMAIKDFGKSKMANFIEI